MTGARSWRTVVGIPQAGIRLVPMSTHLTVIVLAAGGGTRMKSKTAKVLHEIGGRSMVGHVLAAVQALEPTRVVAVVGHQRDQVGPHIQALMPEATLAVQEEQKGTGHAVKIALEAGGTTTGTVLVVAGDTPLLRGESLRDFAAEHEAAQCAVSVLSGIVDDPYGYGRIVRNDEGDVEAIVEEKDATHDQREPARDQLGDPRLRRRVPPRCAAEARQRQRQGRVLPHRHRRPGPRRRAGGRRVPHRRLGPDRGSQRPGAARPSRPRAQPPHRRELDARRGHGDGPCDHLGGLRRRRWRPTSYSCPAPSCWAPRWSPRTRSSGPTAPSRTARSAAAPGSCAPTVSSPSSVRAPPSDRSPTCARAPCSATAGRSAPSWRPRTPRSGPAPRCPHLSYVGDADIGEGSNIGAGTIFANYDGTHKHHTTVGRGAKTGANNTFVAPVTIGDGAITGGGAVVRRDVPPGASSRCRAAPSATSTDGLPGRPLTTDSARDGGLCGR